MFKSISILLIVTQLNSLYTFGQEHILQPDNNLSKFKSNSLELNALDKKDVDIIFGHLKNASPRISEKAQNFKIFGSFLNDLGAMRMSKIYIDSAVRLEQKYHFSSTPCFVENTRASLFFANEDYPSAIDQYKLTLKKLNTSGYYVASPCNNIGYAFLKIGRLDSSEYYLNQALFQMKNDSLNKPSFFISINDNLGELYLEKEKYKEALIIFLRNLRLSTSIGNERRIDQARIQTARCYSFLGDWRKSKTILDGLEISKRSLRYNQFILIYELYLKARKEYYLNLGDKVEVEKNARKNESVKFLESRHKMALLDYTITQYDQLVSEQTKAKLYLLELNKRNIEQKATKNKYLLIFGLVISLLALSMAILFWRFRLTKLKGKATEEKMIRLETEAKLKDELAIRENLEVDVASKQSNMVDMSIEVKRQQNWINDIANNLLLKMDSSEEKEHLKMVINEIKFQLMSDRKQRTVHNYFDESSQSFSTSLLKKYPNLTKTEIELCSLIRLNLSNKEIAAFRGVQYQSVIMSRKRLRKKMNMKKGEDLYQKIKLM